MKVRVLNLEVAEQREQFVVASREQHAMSLSLKQAEKDLGVLQKHHDVLQANHTTLLKAHGEVAASLIENERRRTTTANSYGLRR